MDQEAHAPDAVSARSKAVESLLRATVDSVDYLASVVRSREAEPALRVRSAQALLTLGGVAALAQRGAQGDSGGSQRPPQVQGLLDMLTGGASAPRSRWEAQAVNRAKCRFDHCDWPAHRGGETACGHTVEAGFKDGCGFNHSMMADCGPVPDGVSTRSNFWKLRSA